MVIAITVKDPALGGVIARYLASQRSCKVTARGNTLYVLTKPRIMKGYDSNWAGDLCVVDAMQQAMPNIDWDADVSAIGYGEAI